MRDVRISRVETRIDEQEPEVKFLVILDEKRENFGLVGYTPKPRETLTLLKDEFIALRELLSKYP